jgi:iron(III) transport system ATP-binding protein
MSLLRLDNVYKSYGNYEVVRALSFEIAKGTALGLFGPTGCGKTTVLRMIAGLDRPDAGTIELNGEVASGNGRFIPPGDRRIGMVFQHLALWPHLDVERQIDFVLKARYRDKVARRQRLEWLIEKAQLGHRRQSIPSELSGGESQCLAIARALANDPQLILVDEPGAHLHASLRVQMLDWLTDLRREGLTIVLVTHDAAELRAYCDRAIDMSAQPYTEVILSTRTSF